MSIILVVLWGAVIIVSVVAEMATVQFVSVWFAFSALIAMIMAILGAPLWMQFAVFSAVTAVLLIATRPLVKKLRGGVVRTNYDMNIGRTATVTEDIKSGGISGRAVLDGVSWIAVSEDGSSISAGDPVVVKDVDGAKLIVSKV